jgi:hypothetical protein
MRVVSVQLVTVDLSANFTELEWMKAEYEASLLQNASNASFFISASSSTTDDVNATAAPTNTPTSAPTPAPTPIPLLTVEVRFEGMVSYIGSKCSN